MTDCSECCNPECPIADDNFDRGTLNDEVTYTVLSGSTAMVGNRVEVSGADAIVCCDSEDDAGGIPAWAGIDVVLNHSGDEGRLFIKADSSVSNAWFIQVTAGIDAGMISLYERTSGSDTLRDSVPVIICGLKKYRMEICYGEGRVVGRAAGYAVEYEVTTDIDDKPFAAFGNGVASGAAKFDNFIYQRGYDADDHPSCKKCMAKGAIPPQMCFHAPGCRPGDASVQNTMYLPEQVGSLIAEIEMHGTSIAVNSEYDPPAPFGDTLTDCCDGLNDMTWSSCIAHDDNGSHKCLHLSNRADPLCRCPFFLWGSDPYDDCSGRGDLYTDTVFDITCGAPTKVFHHPLAWPLCGYDADLNTPGDNVTSGVIGGNIYIARYGGWLARLTHTADVPRWQLVFYIGSQTGTPYGAGDMGRYFVYEGPDLTFDSDVGLYQPLGDFSMTLVDGDAYGSGWGGTDTCDNVATATVNFSVNQLPADDPITCSTTTTTSTTEPPAPCDSEFCSFDCASDIWEVTTPCEGGTCQCYTSEGVNISDIEGDSCDGCIGDSCNITCLGNPIDGYHWVKNPAPFNYCQGDNEFCDCWFDGIETILGTECDFDTEYLDQIGGVCGGAGAWGYCYSTAAP